MWESQCAVVVPRLLLPLIFRRRREQLISTESLRRSSPWVVRGQVGYAREDSDEQTRDLYELLKSHLQVRGGVSVRYRVPCVVLGLCAIVALVLFRGCARWGQ